MGPGGDPHPRTTLATLVSSGLPQTEVKLPERFPSVPDLPLSGDLLRPDHRFLGNRRRQPVLHQQRPDRHEALINVRVRLGCVEEWTVNNCSAENHVFHHH